jgi:hypothetical protein
MTFDLTKATDVPIFKNPGRYIEFMGQRLPAHTQADTILQPDKTGLCIYFKDVMNYSRKKNSREEYSLLCILYSEILKIPVQICKLRLRLLQ